MKFVPSYEHVLLKAEESGKAYLRVVVDDLDAKEIEEGRRVGADVTDGKTPLWFAASDEGFALVSHTEFDEAEAAYQQYRKAMQ